MKNSEPSSCQTGPSVKPNPSATSSSRAPGSTRAAIAAPSIALTAATGRLPGLETVEIAGDDASDLVLVERPQPGKLGHRDPRVGGLELAIADQAEWAVGFEQQPIGWNRFDDLAAAVAEEEREGTTENE